MKALKYILLSLGILMILFNLIGLTEGYSSFNPPEKDWLYTFLFYFGLHLFILTGITCLIIAYLLHKKLKRRNKIDVDVDSIGADL